MSSGKSAWVVTIVAVAIAGIIAAYALVNIDESTTFTVTYDLNGGTGECPEPITVHAGTFEPDVSNPPTKTDYEFVGWGKDSAVKSGFDKWPSNVRISSDTVLYAIWSPVVTGHQTQISGYDSGFSYSSYSGTKNHAPSDGYYYVVVQIEITDVSYSGFESISSTDFTIDGSDGQKYSSKTTLNDHFNSMKGTTDTILIGTIGKSSTIYSVYEFPDGVTPEVIWFVGDDEYSWKWV